MPFKGGGGATATLHRSVTNESTRYINKIKSLA